MTSHSPSILTDDVAKLFGFPSCPPAVVPQLEQLIASILAEDRAQHRTDHPIREALKDAMKQHDLSKLSLRQIAAVIGMPKCHPQRIKHHLIRLLPPEKHD